MSTFKFRPNERAKNIFNFYADYYESDSIKHVFDLAFGKDKHPQGLDHDNNWNRTYHVYINKGTPHNQTRNRILIGTIDEK